MLTTRTFAALAASALALVSAPAMAGEAALIANEDGSRSMEISYADLNLTSDAGVAALDKRINRAIAKVCKTDNRFDQLKCRDVARKGAAKRTEVAIAQAHSKANYAAAQGKDGAVVGN